MTFSENNSMTFQLKTIKTLPPTVHEFI